MKPLPEMYQKENIKRLTDMHIRRYEGRIASGSKVVNLTECQAYLDIWKSIAAKDYEWLKLDSREKGEVGDAIDDEV